jgi:hypothetical protein
MLESLVKYIKAKYVGQHYALTSFIFRILLGLVYLVVFSTHICQALFLIGSKGLLPITETLTNNPGLRFWNFPTLHLWLNSDFWIIALMVLGIVFSILLILGYFPKSSLIALFILYLSLVTSGRDFFYFQWDNLLLEATFIAFFIPLSGKLFGKKELREPSKIFIFLFLWLLFRLYFESGIAKLIDGPEWIRLTAMQIYYQTAPLPSIFGWVMSLLPNFVHALTNIVVLLAEILVPLLFFFPRRFKIIAFYILLPFQLPIMLTANYGFFNLLTLVLSLFLLDDEHIGFLLSKFRIKFHHKIINKPRHKPAKYLSAALAIFLVVFSILGFLHFTSPNFNSHLQSLEIAITPYRIINTYHLFLSIVKERQIIEIAGFDGRVWKPVLFRHTNQNPEKMPPFLPFYQDRFAFQYSFIMLGQIQSEYFFNIGRKVCNDIGGLAPVLEDRSIAKEKFTKIRLDLYKFEFSDFRKMYDDRLFWNKQFLRSSEDIDCASLSSR